MALSLSRGCMFGGKPNIKSFISLLDSDASTSSFHLAGAIGLDRCE